MVDRVGHPPRQRGVEVVAVAPACRLRRQRGVALVLVGLSVAYRPRHQQALAAGLLVVYRLRRQRGVVAVTSPGQILVGAVGQWAVDLVGHPPHQHGVVPVVVAPACRLRRLSLGQEGEFDGAVAAGKKLEAVGLAYPPPHQHARVSDIGWDAWPSCDRIASRSACRWASASTREAGLNRP